MDTKQRGVELGEEGHMGERKREREGGREREGEGGREEGAMCMCC